MIGLSVNFMIWQQSWVDGALIRQIALTSHLNSAGYDGIFVDSSAGYVYHIMLKIYGGGIVLSQFHSNLTFNKAVHLNTNVGLPGPAGTIIRKVKDNQFVHHSLYKSGGGNEETFSSFDQDFNSYWTLKKPSGYSYIHRICVDPVSTNILVAFYDASYQLSVLLANSTNGQMIESTRSIQGGHVAYKAKACRMVYGNWVISTFYQLYIFINGGLTQYKRFYWPSSNYGFVTFDILNSNFIYIMSGRYIQKVLFTDLYHNFTINKSLYEGQYTAVNLTNPYVPITYTQAPYTMVIGTIATPVYTSNDSFIVVTKGVIYTPKRVQLLESKQYSLNAGDYFNETVPEFACQFGNSSLLPLTFMNAPSWLAYNISSNRLQGTAAAVNTVYNITVIIDGSNIGYIIIDVFACFETTCEQCNKTILNGIVNPCWKCTPTYFLQTNGTCRLNSTATVATSVGTQSTFTPQTTATGVTSALLATAGAGMLGLANKFAGTGSTQSLWALVNLYQLALTILILDFTHPQNIINYLTDLEFASMNFDILFSTFNPSISFLIAQKQQNQGMEYIGYESQSLIVSQQSFFTSLSITIILNIGVTGLKMLLQLMFKDRLWVINKVKDKLGAVSGQMFLGSYIRMVFEGYLFLCIVGLFEFRYFNSSLSGSYLSIAITILTFIFICSVPVLICVTYCVSVYSTPIMPLSGLIADVKLTSWKSGMFHCVFLLRRMCIAVVLTLRFTKYQYQVAIYGLMSVVYTMYLIRVRPFKLRLDNLIQITCEVGFMVICCVVSLVNQQQSLQSKYGSIIINIFFINGILVNMTLAAALFHGLASKLFSKIKSKVSPTTIQPTKRRIKQPKTDVKGEITQTNQRLVRKSYLQQSDQTIY